MDLYQRFHVARPLLRFRPNGQDVSMVLDIQDLVVDAAGLAGLWARSLCRQDKGVGVIIVAILRRWCFQDY